MVFFVELKISDGTVVHGIFEIVLSHESGDKFPEIFFFHAHFVRDVGDHEPSHFFGIDEGGSWDVGSVIDSGYPWERIPEFAFVVILISSVVAERGAGTLSFTFASLSRDWGHGDFDGHWDFGRLGFSGGLFGVFLVFTVFILSWPASLPISSIPSIIILIVSMIPSRFMISIFVSVLISVSFPVSVSIISMAGSFVMAIGVPVASMVILFMVSGSRWMRGLPGSVSVFVFLLLFFYRPRSLIGFRGMRSRSGVVFFLDYLEWYLFVVVLGWWNNLVICRLGWLNLFFLILTFSYWFLTASASRRWRYQRRTLLTPLVFPLHFLSLALHLAHFYLSIIFIRDRSNFLLFITLF